MPQEEDAHWCDSAMRNVGLRMVPSLASLAISESLSSIVWDEPEIDCPSTRFLLHIARSRLSARVPQENLGETWRWTPSARIGA